MHFAGLRRHGLQIRAGVSFSKGSKDKDSKSVSAMKRLLHRSEYFINLNSNKLKQFSVMKPFFQMVIRGVVRNHQPRIIN
jgi:hypothetical protein